jgi:archaellum component FlaF (FlaF/FlaG flagellin family)
MKNYFIIAIIVVAIGYMFVIMKDKYDNIKETNQKITQQK